VCYDHLAGDHAVTMFDGFVARDIVRWTATPSYSATGQGFFQAVGIDTSLLLGQRRPMCRACLDWSVRRTHLAGTLGAAILDKIVSEKWARREKDSRAVRPPGRTAFQEDSSGRIMPEWKQKPGAMAGLFRASSAEIRLRRR
jgi:hypothetical protein